MNEVIFHALRVLRRGVAGAFLILAACNEKNDSEAPESPGPFFSTLSEGGSSEIKLSGAGEADPNLMSLDPLKDGWDSEHLNVIAGGRLKELGHAFEDEGGLGNGDALADLFVPDARCGELRPSDLEQVFSEEETTVYRPKHGAENRAPKVWETAMSEFEKSFPEGGERHSKFKIIGVNPGEGGFETRQLVSLNGRKETMAWEQNATWKIDWEYGGEDQDPVIRSILVEQFEEVRSESSAKWFRDCTASVLRNEIDTAIRQFGVGVGQWKERLNDHLLVMQFGHNGLAVGDVNGDGLEDLYRCQLGGLPNRLLMGQPDGTVIDRTREAGLDFLDNCRGALLIDLDNDGDQDLVLAMPLQIVMFKNDGGGRFELGARIDQQNVYSFAAADFDADGDLDVYGCAYYSEPEVAAELPIPMPAYDARNGGRNILLRNEGAWKFSNATAEVGLDEDNSRFSFSAIWEDYNNDGELDLYVVNDFGHNNLYRNENGKFAHVTDESGTKNGTFGMSASAGDYNRDGWMDFYKASMYSSAGNRVVTQPQFLPEAGASLKKTMLQMAQGNTLFANQGDGSFEDYGSRAGVAMGRWSWGSIFSDFNNDGWEDLFVANGFVTGRKPDDL